MSTFGPRHRAPTAIFQFDQPDEHAQALGIPVQGTHWWGEFTVFQVSASVIDEGPVEAYLVVTSYLQPSTGASELSVDR